MQHAASSIHLHELLDAADISSIDVRDDIARAKTSRQGLADRLYRSDGNAVTVRVRSVRGLDGETAARHALDLREDHASSSGALLVGTCGENTARIRVACAIILSVSGHGGDDARLAVLAVERRGAGDIAGGGAWTRASECGGRGGCGAGECGVICGVIGGCEAARGHGGGGGGVACDGGVGGGGVFGVVGAGDPRHVIVLDLLDDGVVGKVGVACVAVETSALDAADFTLRLDRGVTDGHGLQHILLDLLHFDDLGVLDLIDTVAINFDDAIGGDFDLSVVIDFTDHAECLHDSALASDRDLESGAVDVGASLSDHLGVSVGRQSGISEDSVLFFDGTLLFDLHETFHGNDFPDGSVNDFLKFRGDFHLTFVRDFDTTKGCTGKDFTSVRVGVVIGTRGFRSRNEHTAIVDLGYSTAVVIIV